MSLNRYGILIKQYLQENYPDRFKELKEKGIIDDVIEKRQNEIMKNRIKIKEDNDCDDERVDKLLEKLMYKPL